MQDSIKFQVTYRQKTYAFSSGSEVYIFHAGIYKDMDELYGIDILLKFVELTYDCYISDSNRTPLGSLADYIAENWEQIQELSNKEIFERFYNEEFYP